GYQIASAPAVYEVKGKEYVAITIGGTPTSSYGGTASQLMVFALKGNTAQLPAPPLRPPGAGPGYLSEPPRFLSLAAEPRTIELQVIASMNAPSGANTLNGTSHGAMTVRVPAGWRVNVTFANHAAARRDGVAVLPLNGAGPPAGSVAFGGGESGEGAPAGVAYFHFTPSSEGDYAIASTDQARTAGGEWIRFDVGPADSAPLLVVRGSRYALTPAGRHG